MERMVVGSLMSRDVVAVSPDSSVYTAANLMSSKGVGSCVVVRDDKPVGILTERDIVRRVVAAGLSPRRTAVSKVMSSPVIVVGENTSVREALSVMSRNKIRRLVVVRDDVLVGIVSVTDFVRALGETGYAEVVPVIAR
jgi:CBS domain-containing protein